VHGRGLDLSGARIRSQATQEYRGRKELQSWSFAEGLRFRGLNDTGSRAYESALSDVGEPGVRMKVLVTCGPSYEPVDRVRRLTNMSTGALGVRLAERLASGGCQVHCLKGVGATHPDPAGGVVVEYFTTNDDLESRLERAAINPIYGAVFHVAALCDYRVTRVEDSSGRERVEGKVPSEAGELWLRLVPARKLIGRLRDWFPRAWLVGWKYEVEGGRAEVVERGWSQVAVNRTDACVVNGPAWGGGFGVCEPPDRVVECADPEGLLSYLSGRLKL
jgi:phosphopantothenate---cysteine ligase (CTP)